MFQHQLDTDIQSDPKKSPCPSRPPPRAPHPPRPAPPRPLPYKLAPSQDESSPSNLRRSMCRNPNDPPVKDLISFFNSQVSWQYYSVVWTLSKTDMHRWRDQQHVSLRRRARNVRPRFLYRQYTNFRFVSQRYLRIAHYVYCLKGEPRPEISLLHMKVPTLIKAKSNVFLW